MRRWYAVIILWAGLSSLILVTNSYGQCSPQERIELGRQGYTREEVNEICGEASRRQQAPPPNYPNQPRPYQSPPPAAFCCDFVGNRRCMMNPLLGSTTIGGPCFCYGQGQGIGCP
jgi:hypothetical protein